MLNPKTTLFLLLTVFLVACSGDDGADGLNGANSITTQTELSADDTRCEAGGVEINSGTDTNGNGSLDSNEITNTSVTCNGLDATGDASGTLPFEEGYTLPNIIFVVADDVGVDQFESFGFGGLDAPAVPTLDSLAESGVRFANTWSMPTCSATRVALFTGRYPPQTNVNTAIVSIDLANSQMSPYELALPKVLARSGYENAYIGKIHASGSDVNPANYPLGDATITTLGWDYFAGYLDGGPRPIDSSAGLTNRLATDEPYTCGFIPTSADHPQGADQGACYIADGTCQDISNSATASAGKQCLDRGGILDPNASCAAQPPAHVDFSRANAYYTADLIISDDLGVRTIPTTDPRTRKHRTALETDLALDWVQSRKQNRPWMLTIGYSSAHAPLQPVPDDLIPGATPLEAGVSCTGIRDVRALMNQNLTGIDAEIGRLLQGIGVMKTNEAGELVYDPESNTVVAFIGDNGSLGTTVKAPFIPARAKASIYQGGVWIPMLVTTPYNANLGARVDHLTNVVDLYQLFSTLAEQELSSDELDRLDVKPLLPYLTEVSPPPQRDYNFTYSGRNIQLEKPAPCVLPDLTICLQLFPQQAVCQSEGGDWYGEGGVVSGQSFDSCCAVNEYFTSQGQEQVAILAETQAAIRNRDYKLLRFEEPNCAAGGVLSAREELYRLTAGTNNPEANLDNFAVEDLLTDGVLALEVDEKLNYDDLAAELDKTLANTSNCAGDGNQDGVIDQRDIDDWEFWANKTSGQSSWYDINLDGLTDEADKQIIEDRLGVTCP